jgi:hypothetical protein
MTGAAWILVVIVLGGDLVPTIGVIEGFVTEAACTTAGDRVTAAVRSDNRAYAAVTACISRYQ